jgi:hypothetical protein
MRENRRFNKQRAEELILRVNKMPCINHFINLRDGLAPYALPWFTIKGFRGSATARNYQR